MDRRGFFGACTAIAAAPQLPAVQGPLSLEERIRRLAKAMGKEQRQHPGAIVHYWVHPAEAAALADATGLPQLTPVLHCPPGRPRASIRPTAESFRRDPSWHGDLVPG